MIFFRFQTHFRWDASQPCMDLETVRNLWEKQARVRYDDMVGKCRNSGKKAAWIDSAVWDLWRAYWNTPEFKAKSARQRAIRRANPANHSSGSRSHLETIRLLVCFFFQFVVFVLIIIYIL